MLRALFPEEAEGSLSLQSNESSCSLPSILNDSGDIKQAKPAQWLYSTVLGKQGNVASSGCYGNKCICIVFHYSPCNDMELGRETFKGVDGKKCLNSKLCLFMDKLTAVLFSDSFFNICCTLTR